MSHRPRLPGLTVAAILLVLVVRPLEAPATVAEQRARLPPPAECADAIEGRWRAIYFRSLEDDQWWSDFTLEIHRVAGSDTAIEGVIRVHNWLGGPEQSEPAPCSNGRRYILDMKATGTFADGNVDFAGGPWEIVEIPCGTAADVAYNSDHFTGAIDRDLNEFQSVNNDGVAAVNVPTVFRRVACFDDAPTLRTKDVVPPPFFPSRPSGGC